MKAALEVAPGLHQHVGRGPRPAKGGISESAATPIQRRRIRHDHEQIVVAIRPGIAAGMRPEEIDSLGSVGGGEAANRVSQPSLGESTADVLGDSREPSPLAPDRKARSIQRNRRSIEAHVKASTLDFFELRSMIEWHTRVIHHARAGVEGDLAQGNDRGRANDTKLGAKMRFRRVLDEAPLSGAKVARRRAQRPLDGVEQKQSPAEELLEALGGVRTRQEHVGGPQHLEQVLAEVIQRRWRRPKTSGRRRRFGNEYQLSSCRCRRARGRTFRGDDQAGAQTPTLLTGVDELLHLGPGLRRHPGFAVDHVSATDRPMPRMLR